MKQGINSRSNNLLTFTHRYLIPNLFSYKTLHPTSWISSVMKGDELPDVLNN